MIKVYFKRWENGLSELVAIFIDEETYLSCKLNLEKKAREKGLDLWISTEKYQDLNKLKQ
jgi:hypothetical protein